MPNFSQAPSLSLANTYLNPDIWSSPQVVSLKTLLYSVLLIIVYP